MTDNPPIGYTPCQMHITYIYFVKKKKNLQMCRLAAAPSPTSTHYHRRSVPIRRDVQCGVLREEVRRANRELKCFDGPGSLVSFTEVVGEEGAKEKREEKDRKETYMTGQSSTRGLWVMPKQLHTTTSASSTTSPRLTASATPSASTWLCRVYRPPA